MSGVLVTSVLDIGRALGPNPETATIDEVEAWLAEYIARKGFGFNYDPAIACMPRLLEGTLSLEQAEAFCWHNGSPKGHAENASVVRALAGHRAAFGSRFYEQRYVAVVIGRWRGQSIYATVKVPAVRVMHDQVYLVWPGLRKTFRP